MLTAASTNPPGLGCVFNIQTDPAETADLAPGNPRLLAELRARFFERNATQFDGPRCPPSPALCKRCVAPWADWVVI